MSDNHIHKMFPDRQSVIEHPQWYECSVCGFRATEEHPTQIVDVETRVERAARRANVVPYA